MAPYLQRLRIWIVLLGCIGSMPSMAGAPTPSVGLNKFDLFKQYLGTASGGNGSPQYRKVTQAMARKAIADAKDIGVTYFRVAATGFAPSSFQHRGDLELWLRDRTQYWSLFDTMMSDLLRKDLRIVPVFVWNASQFPAITRETAADMVRDQDSRAWRLLTEYISEFILRYKAHPALYFYELTNELNNLADLDQVRRCREQYKDKRLVLCEPKGNFSTDDMLTFVARLAALVRRLDPSRQVSSGFSVPRAAASGLRRRPEWVAGAVDWTPDSKEEFKRHLVDIHRDVDIVSVHLYQVPDNRRFGAQDVASLLDWAKEAAHEVGKPLFVGEFGDPNALKSEGGSFVDTMLEKIASLRIPFSAVWVWQFYQTAPHVTHNNRATRYSLEPGFTDRLNAKITDTNNRLGNPPPLRQVVDTTPPRVVLTWPLECSVVRRPQQVCAVASDDGGPVALVEFLIAGRRVAIGKVPPYCFVLDPDLVPTGEMSLVARASDGAGNVAEFQTSLIVGAPGNKPSACTNSVIPRQPGLSG